MHIDANPAKEKITNKISTGSGMRNFERLPDAQGSFDEHRQTILTRETLGQEGDSFIACLALSFILFSLTPRGLTMDMAVRIAFANLWLGILTVIIPHIFYRYVIRIFIVEYAYHQYLRGHILSERNKKKHGDTESSKRAERTIAEISQRREKISHGPDIHFPGSKYF